MTLLESLLDAIVRLEGDALVMHVGEKPYVVTTSSAMNAHRGPLAWGQVELSSRVLTSDAVLNMVGQILPQDQRHALEEVGAVEHTIDSPLGIPDRFTVVAARGGDDIWVELRRHPGALELESRGTGTAEASTPDAHARATSEAPNVAVGLEEPRPSASEPSPQQSSERPQTSASSDAGAPIDPGVGGAREPTTVEERVPVLDEVGTHEPERIEHIFIPLQAIAPGAGDTGDTGDGALELVETEPQHSPTEEDVDSLLATTASDLLSVNSGSTSSGLREIEFTQVPDLEEAIPQFQIVTEDSQESENGEFDDDSVDLTAALDELPATLWAPVHAENSPRKAVDEVWPLTRGEIEGAAPPGDEPAAAAGQVSPTAAQQEEPELIVPASPAVMSDGLGGSDKAVEREVVAASEPDSEPRAQPARDEAAYPEPWLQLDDNVPEGAWPNPEVVADEPLSPPGPSVEKTASASSIVTPETAPPPQPMADAPSVGQLSVVASPIEVRGYRSDRPVPHGRVEDASVVRILREAVDRGAATVYVVAQSKPMVRVDGEISALDDNQPLSDEEIGRMISTLEPGDAVGAPGDASREWISEVAEIGRVRCVTFRDHRGQGIIFRLTPARSISADHLNLAPEIRELATLTDGLVLVVGARGSGKSTLLNSFVDLINRSRGEHVITVETAIGFVHDSKRSFVSQREVGDDAAAAAAAVGTALREDPDVLVVDEVKSADMVKAALQAAESGRLVFASLTFGSASAALEGLTDLVPAAERATVRVSLAAVLRAVVSQVLLRKTSGGHVAARGLLLSSPAVAASIRQGELSGLAAAVEDGSPPGMLLLNDSLAALVRDGTVRGAEACRRAPDRPALLSSLARHGIDTSFAKRLA